MVGHLRKRGRKEVSLFVADFSLGKLKEDHYTG